MINKTWNNCIVCGKEMVNSVGGLASIILCKSADHTYGIFIINETIRQEYLDFDNYSVYRHYGEKFEFICAGGMEYILAEIGTFSFQMFDTEEKIRKLIVLV